MIFKLIFVVTLSTLLDASDVAYSPEKVGDLLVKNAINDSFERLIHINDMLLIDMKGDSKNYAGKFLGIQDQSIFISKKHIIDSTMIQISINEIDVIYVGIGETFEQIRSRWGLGFALAAIPGSFMMANTGPEPQVGSRGFGALISWGLLGSMSYLFCGNLFGGIDYSIKINKSEKFIIGSDYWVIKKNSSKSQPRLGRW